MKKKAVIEFSEHWIKAVVSSGMGIKHNSVEKIIFDPVEPGMLNAHVALNKVFEKIGRMRDLEALVVLSRNKVTLRKLDLPSREQSEIESMLKLHVVRQVPYPKEDIVWGYQNLGFDGINNSSVLLGVVHRELLRNIFNAFLSFNIMPEAMLISSQGVIHYLQNSLKEKPQPQGAYLILDIDYNFSDLILVSNNNLKSSIVISRGAEQLKSEEEGEKFNSELKQALVIFNNESPKPGRLFLTGAASSAEALISGYIEKDLGLKFQCVKAEEAKGAEAIDTLSSSAVLGFTYQRKKQDISFVLPEAQIKREIKLKVRQLLLLGACVTYIFILSGALALIRIQQLQAYRDKLNSRVEQLRASAGELSRIAERINIVKKYWDAEQSAANYIYELIRICPENITLTNFNWEWQKKAGIRGFASEMPDVSAFVKALNNSKSFSNMQQRYMRRRKIKDREAVDFEIESK